MNIQLIEKIERLGLQHNEARVYVGLLELGSATVTELAKYSQLNRTTLYDILNRLEIYTLISKAEGKKGRYVAEHPQAFSRYLQNKKRTAERAAEEGADLQETLEEVYQTDLKPVIKVGYGKEQMAEMYNHALEAGEEIYSVLNLSGYAEVFDELGKQQSSERARSGMKQKVLAIDNGTARKWYKETYEGNKRRSKHTTYKWVEAEGEDLPVGEVVFFDDKIIAMLSSPEENIAYEIKSKSFAGFLKILFEQAWNQE